jgi:hypothetical protein
MKTLHLNLKRKWFDMILSGKKQEEYREVKPHWAKQLLANDKIVKAAKFKYFDTITFSNGYAKNRDQFSVELKGIEIREGKAEWGAKEGVKYFVLKLGKILDK